MTIEIEELLRWQPDNFSEDHVTNFLAKVLKKSGLWHLVYYNPPSGSWKSLFLVKGDYEYRQVGPKRGVGRIKRPDLALEIYEESEKSTTLFLIEAKLSRNEWDPELITLLRAYFEGTGTSKSSKSVRMIPFSHRRLIGTIEWEELEEGDADREWFKKHNVTYIFGFAYALGLVSPKTDLSLEKNWMNRTITKLGGSPPPLVLMAVGWLEGTYAPFLVTQFSDTFPAAILKELESIFSQYSAESRIKSSTLNQFV